MFLRRLIRQNALFVINSSGGKDSQAMTIKLQAIIPAAQLVIVHSLLGEVEWEGSVEHIQATSFGLPVLLCSANKTLLEMVEHRHKTRPDVSPWPSPQFRQCTSDLKRGPLEKAIRGYAKANGFTTIVNCMGMRGQESCNRSRLKVWKLNRENSVAGRTWWDWLPIHKKTVRQVWSIIKKSGQKPFWTYAEGMSRKSCCFCIMASRPDLIVAARLKPALATKYIDLERRTGYSMAMPVNGKPQWLSDLIKPAPKTQLSIF